MRILAVVVGVASLLLMVNAGTGQQKTDQSKITSDLSFLEKQYGLKIKSFEQVIQNKIVYYKGLLEFGKDLPEAQIKELQEALNPALNPAGGKMRIHLHFFDKDNVNVTANGPPNVLLDGVIEQISGIKGEAFRISVHTQWDKNRFESLNIRKMVIRPNYKVEPPKGESPKGNISPK